MIEDRFSEATKTLDFYYGSEHLWSLACHLHPDSSELAAAWIKPLLYQLRRPPEHRLIHTLEELLAAKVPVLMDTEGNGPGRLEHSL